MRIVKEEVKGGLLYRMDNLSAKRSGGGKVKGQRRGERGERREREQTFSINPNPNCVCASFL